MYQLCLNLYKNEFIEITTKLSAVVACRCSPTQKADVARLIRHHTKKRVCCIGDGGNDVSMIQAADVGESINVAKTCAIDLPHLLVILQVLELLAKKENRPPLPPTSP
jgi:P-type E1-E2 ATPase